LVVSGVDFPRGSSGEVQLDAGSSLGGHRLRIPVTVVRGARSGPRLLVVAGLRGDEVTAIQGVRDLLARLDPERLRGDLLAVPVADVAGFLGRPASGRSRLARSFPGDPQGAAAARQAQVLFHEVVRQADLVLVLSAWPAGRTSLPHVRGAIEAPGVLPLAAATGASIVVDEPDRPGALTTAAISAGRAAVRYDLGPPHRLDAYAALGAAQAVQNVLRGYDMLPGREPRRPRPTVVRIVEAVRAPAGGVVELRVRPGQVVRQGEVLAEIASPWSQERQLSCAPAAGLVLATAARAVVAEGNPVAWLGTGVRRPPPPLPFPADAPQASGDLRAGRPAARGAGSRIVVGWSEWVALPDLGVPRLKAKIDTGARTCALHVVAMRKVGEDARGRTVLELQVPTGSRAGRGKVVTAQAKVVEIVTVRDSGGRPTRRPVIETTLAIGPVQRHVRVTLTDRGEMLFPMLVGRTGLGGDFVVDVGARYLLGRRE
jgi:predicted deacylase